MRFVTIVTTFTTRWKCGGRQKKSKTMTVDAIPLRPLVTLVTVVTLPMIKIVVVSSNKT